MSPSEWRRVGNRRLVSSVWDDDRCLSPLRCALPPDDRAKLRRWARSAQLPAVLVQRARILLLAADGVSNTEIAERVGVSRPTVIACRRRSVRRGLDGLDD
ncbi:MAG TPA: helix-turn-helix domain-containing protein [Actinomycetes bacterium]|nr:helix-turn-helix domain-containing protein [Actinomycetes bacterium]